MGQRCYTYLAPGEALDGAQRRVEGREARRRQKESRLPSVPSNAGLGIIPSRSYGCFSIEKAPGGITRNYFAAFCYVALEHV